MEDSHTREQSIVQTAGGLPEAKRKLYLDRACGGDEALRRQVEEQLHIQSSTRPGSQDTTVTAPNQEPGFQFLAREKAGDVIGRYKLLLQLGEGGMGCVWKAEQVEPVKREVALKVIRAGFDSEQILTRFAAERQALAMMDHPSIAKVLDAGTTANGRPFFVMELVAGSSITQFCDTQQLSIRERLELFVPVCQAVQHAHQKGIIHRDLKPSNVLVTSYDGRPVPKIIDFGVAKATRGTLTDQTIVTEFGAVVGTLGYMSPEQAETDQPDIDTRSDVYCLGVMLYELLTGTTPFVQEELRKTPLHEALRRIREEEPPKPSTRLAQNKDRLSLIAAQRKQEPSRLIHSLKGDLDWIVMNCLEKDRKRRYETANGVAMELQRYLQNEPVLARPPSKTYRVQKLIRRNKLASALTAAVAVALVLGGTFSLWLAARATKAEHKSRRVAHFLEDMLQGVGPSVARGRDTLLLRDILERTAKSVDKALAKEPDVGTEIDDTIATVYTELGEYAKAEGILRTNLARRRVLYGERHRDVATSLNNLGIVLADERQLTEAEATLQKALALRTKLLGPEDLEVAASLNSLGNVYRLQDKLPKAETLLRRGLAIRKKLHENEDPDIAESLNDLSMVLKDEGQLDEAEALQRQALAMTRKLQGDDHYYVCNSLNSYPWRSGKVGRSRGITTRGTGVVAQIAGH